MKWWTKSWNPIIGCTKCSPACDNCYAEALHTQRHKALLAGKKMAPCYSTPFAQVRNLPERLDDPLHWRKPQRIFVGNMGDLFHEDVPAEWLDRVFAVMAMCPQHTFMLLTKRPERMPVYFDHPNRKPLPNVWLGATIWDQPSADRAVPILLNTPAAKRFVSVEPMLGPVSFIWEHGTRKALPSDHFLNFLDWVICGGETGPGARPMHPDWPRKLCDQCQAAEVPFFYKQHGAWAEVWTKNELPGDRWVGDKLMRPAPRGAKGRKLDGRTWGEVPV